MLRNSGVIVRYASLALVDALAVYGVIALAGFEKWGMLVALVVATVAVNATYATKRFVPLKYLMPGIVLLLVYQVYVVLYTGAASFTNVSDFNNGTRDDAVVSILSQHERRVAGSEQYQLTVLDKDGTIAFLVTDKDQAVSLGRADKPLERLDGATLQNGKAVALDGWTTLSFDQILQRQKEVTGFRAPFSDDPTDGSLRTQDGSTAYVFKPTATYDAANGTLTVDGDVYTADQSVGAFKDAAGKRLNPGWQVFNGVDNYRTVLANKAIRGPFLGVLAWTIVFAFLGVALSFALGLLTALVFDVGHMRGRRLYRSLLILPYAIPVFASAGVFKGLLNTQFGFVNATLLGGAQVDWLGDPWLAKLSLVLVNLWLGYPYMFLVCTGALQAIPSDVVEAAKVDGARAWSVFRHIKLPYVMVATAPLLIASYAFNFNNFNLIYLLTNGGPNNVHASINVGYTDILITMVYKLAFGGQQRLYGLASAISILIFLFVAAISIAGFRRTRKLEEMS